MDRSVERYAKRNLRERLPIALYGRYFCDLLPGFSRNRPSDGSGQLLQKGLGFPQIDRVEALGEPVVDLFQ